MPLPAISWLRADMRILIKMKWDYFELPESDLIASSEFVVFTKGIEKLRIQSFPMVELAETLLLCPSRICLPMARPSLLSFRICFFPPDKSA